MTGRAETFFVLFGGQFQIVSAIEAQRHFDIDPSTTVLIANEKILKSKSLRMLPRSETITLPGRYGYKGIRQFHDLVRGVRYVQNLISRQRSHGPIRVFFGAHAALATNVAERLSDASVVFLDDGAGTITAVRRLVSPVAVDHTPLATAALYRMFGLNRTPDFTRTFFTFYDLGAIAPHRRIANNLEWTRSQHAGLKIDCEQLMILGTSAWRRSEGAADRYWSMVARLVAVCGTAVPIYRAHPTEPPHGKSRAEALGLRWQQERSALELDLIDAGVAPGTIIGFGSTAADCLRRTLPEQVDVYNILMSF